MPRAVGLDFGTTNSAIAVVEAQGQTSLASFVSSYGLTNTFRSILFFNAESQRPGHDPVVLAGHRAISEYIEYGGGGRLIQSLKSFLADRAFGSTDIYGHNYRLEDLAAIILVEMRREAQARLGELGTKVVVGRPVNFSGAITSADAEIALTRLRVALGRAGFKDVTFEYEPVGAAYHYAARLERNETVLIADFGGGTSDFSVLKLTRGRDRERPRCAILGNDGVAVAGDAFDSRIVRHLVAPALGRGSRYRSPFGPLLPVPSWIYSRLERWHHLSFLRGRKTMEMLKDVAAGAQEPQKIEALIHLIRDDLGYLLFKAVERLKIELSTRAEGTFHFEDSPVEIEKRVAREEFERWIAPELRAIAGCVDRVMAATGIAAGIVDRVFMTGGSSFVPAVREIFVKRFGAEKLVGGDEFTSVAAGLAVRALNLSSPELEGRE